MIVFSEILTLKEVFQISSDGEDRLFIKPPADITFRADELQWICEIFVKTGPLFLFFRS